MTDGSVVRLLNRTLQRLMAVERALRTAISVECKVPGFSGDTFHRRATAEDVRVHMRDVVMTTDDVETALRYLATLGLAEESCGYWRALEDGVNSKTGANLASSESG